MANFKSPGIKKRILIICAVLALCVPLLLVAKADKGQGNKGGKDLTKCQTVTADAVFRDALGEGIRSGDEYSIYYDKKYYGLEDTLVCLLDMQDNDFILSTWGRTSYEREIEREKGIDRKVTLDFSANDNLYLLPFEPILEVDVLIRVDYVLSDDPYLDPLPKRFLMWFDVGRNNYQLRFDGLDECEWVSVTQTGVSPDRIWTIESIGTQTARLEKVKGKRYTVGHFVMPFRITVTERQGKGPTCL